MKQEIIEKVYGVYGQELPDRILFNATVKSPCTTRLIIKKFKSWAKFEAEYNAYCVSKRNVEAKAKVVTK